MDYPRLALVPPPGRIQLLHDGPVSVVAVEGELDVASGAEFAAVLLRAISGGQAVLVDLCDCTFMDSVGLAALLQASRQARDADVRLAVACLPDSVPRSLFELVFGLASFTTCDSRRAGIDALR